MSGKQEKAHVLCTIPPQGKRKESIVISVSSIEWDEIVESVLDEYILKVVMNLG